LRLDVRTSVWKLRHKETGEIKIAKGVREYNRLMGTDEYEEICKIWEWAEKLLLVAWDRGEERMTRGWYGTKFEAKREDGLLKVYRSYVGVEWIVDVENQRIIKWPRHYANLDLDILDAIGSCFGAKNVVPWRGHLLEEDIVEYLERDIEQRRIKGIERIYRTFHKYHEQISPDEIEEKLGIEWKLMYGWTVEVDRMRGRLYLPRTAKIYRLKHSDRVWKVVVGFVEERHIDINAVFLIGDRWIIECPPFLYLAKTIEPLKRWIMDLTPVHEIVEEVG